MIFVVLMFRARSVQVRATSVMLYSACNACDKFAAVGRVYIFKSSTTYMHNKDICLKLSLINVFTFLN